MNTSYFCNYRRELHARSTRSVEHIIPEVLGNLTLKLSDVCKYWNNHFAASFETPVTNSAFMRAVLREYGLAQVLKGAHFIEEVTTARGTTEYLWLVDGKEVLRDKPMRTRKNTIDFPALDKDGNQHLVQVALPFDYLVGSRGDGTERVDATAKADRDMKRLLEYLQSLARDPGIDPALAQMLQERQLTLPVPKGVDYDIEVQHGSDGGVVSDIEPKGYVHDVELWSRFYLKIGWCFACLKLGSSRLEALEEPEIVRLLRGGAVDPRLVSLCMSSAPEAGEQLFREATPSGVQVWFWRRTIRDTDAIVTTLPSTLAPFVRMALEQRKVDALRVQTWVDFRNPGRLNRSAARPTESDRVHRLRLERIVRGDRVALGCCITLFGGVFEVVTQLSPLMAPAALAGVEMDDEVRLAPARY